MKAGHRIRMLIVAALASAPARHSNRLAVKRHLLAIAILLLLGAVTTLAVAWAPALGLCQRSAVIRTATDWRSAQEAESITAGLSSYAFRRPGWMELLAPSVDLGPGERQKRVLHAYGWPLPSMLCIHVQGSDGDAQRRSHSLHVLEIAGRELPLRPIWSGFALDTVSFAVAWTAAISFLTLACKLWKSAPMRRSQECRQ